MSLLNRTAPAHHTNTSREAPASAARPLPLLGGRYVTTQPSGTPAEGTYVTTRTGGSVRARGTYVTTINRSISERSEGRYTDRS
ncbi:hypothetical protein [Arthrobacter sp. CAN_A1]|uniref:hypothetical protein n=1 Tax=Arthrobacter sp. CAN_A1 TaxID=2787717 RepID=UPI0018CAC9AD